MKFLFFYRLLLTFTLIFIGLTSASFASAATQIFRSVGPGATSALATDSSHANTVSVSGGTATFSAGLPDNVGIGDAVIIDTGGTDQAIDASDTLLFIHGRTSSTVYAVRDHTGATPADISSNDTYSIYRAHTALADAESGTKNTSIPITFNGGNRDLVTNDEQWNVTCYANGTTADTTGTTINGWTTDADRFLKIYTPVNSSEVGLSQRHGGKWDDYKYKLENTGNGIVINSAAYIHIEGMQMHARNSIGNITSMTVTAGNIKISNNILRFTDTGSASWNPIPFGIYLGNTSVKAYIYNNLLYDFIDESGQEGIAIYLSMFNEAYLYNNTILNSCSGIDKPYAYTNYLKNNISYNNIDNYYGTFNNNSTNNISGPSQSDAPGLNPINNATVSFVDASNNDFHLAQSDNVARGGGVNLTSDPGLSVTTDINGQLRNSAGAGWDIGADEGTVEFDPTVMQSGGDYSSLSSWEAGVQTDLIANTTRVFSHGGITGTIADNASVTGQTSGATATVVHATSTKILLENISGTFQSGEIIQVTTGHSVTISDNGNPASAVAKIDGAWTVADTASITINGWTTGENNFIKVYTTSASKHPGKWDEGKYRLVASSGNDLSIYQKYVIIQGLQISLANSSQDAIYLANPNIFILDNIIKSSTSGDAGLDIEVIGTYYIFNNIIYNFEYALYDHTATNSSSILFYNNSVYGCDGTGIYPAGGNLLAINNIVVNNAVDFRNTSYKNNSNNNISLDSSAPGSNSKINVQVRFVSTSNGAEDFHLAPDDKFAKDAGAEIQDFSYLQRDMEGQLRFGFWDIGADETFTQIYRSVGPNATDALADDNSHANTITVSGGVATFSVALPDNIGVGDAVLIDTGGTNQSIDASDTILFVSSRNSSTSYKLQNNNGSIPADIASNDTYSIYRAYTSLFNAESGNENTSIPIIFDGGNMDLVTNNEQWNIACYANGTTADTATVAVEGWTTDVKNFLKIYTPTNPNEVGISQRHMGKWSDDKYKLSFNTVSNHGVDIFNKYTVIEGLQLTGTTAQTLLQNSSGEVAYFVNNIFKDHVNTSARAMIRSYSGTSYIYNNIVYGATYSGQEGIELNDGSFAYNNTVYNCSGGYGISSVGTTAVIKNNISYNNGLGDYYGTFGASSVNNISEDTTSPNSGSTDCGGHSCRNQTVLFISTSSGSEDFNLSQSDTAARGSGANLAGDTYLSFINDIQGKIRPASPDNWSIGAFELSESKKVELKGDQVKMKGIIKLK